MNPSTSGQTIAAAPPPAPAEAAAQAPTAAQAPAAYEACDQGGAPVEASQRYCVVCGTRRKHAYDPAAQFLSGATSRARAAAVPVRGSGPRRRRSFGLATAAVLGAIPLSVGGGGLVWPRGGVAAHSGDTADQRLRAALRAQNPTVVTAGKPTGTAAAPSGATPVSTSVAT